MVLASLLYLLPAPPAVAPPALGVVPLTRGESRFYRKASSIEGRLGLESPKGHIDARKSQLESKAQEQKAPQSKAQLQYREALNQQQKANAIEARLKYQLQRFHGTPIGVADWGFTAKTLRLRWIDFFIIGSIDANAMLLLLLVSGLWCETKNQTKETKVEIEVINQLKTQTSIYYVTGQDAKGIREDLFGVLRPGQAFPITTYVGHIWYAVRDSNKLPFQIKVREVSN
jgi:hypothetical protein